LHVGDQEVDSSPVRTVLSGRDRSPGGFGGRAGHDPREVDVGAEELGPTSTVASCSADRAGTIGDLEETVARGERGALEEPFGHRLARICRRIATITADRVTSQGPSPSAVRRRLPIRLDGSKFVFEVDSRDAKDGCPQTKPSISSTIAGTRNAGERILHFLTRGFQHAMS
jgi:hypothetical protein